MNAHPADPTGRPAGPGAARAARQRDLGLAAVPDTVFDQVAREVAEHFGAGAAMVNLIGQDEQFFVGLYGRPADSGARAFLDEPGRTMGMRDGFCVDVLERPAELALPLDDVYSTPRYFNNAVVTQLGVRSYIGVALVDDDGTRIGTVCAIDSEARSQQAGTSWGTEGVQVLKAARDRVMAEVRARQAIPKIIGAAPGTVMITAVPGLEVLLANAQHARVFGPVARLGTPAHQQYPDLERYGILATLTEHAATGRPAATAPVQSAPGTPTAVFATVPARIPGHPAAALTLGIGGADARDCTAKAAGLAAELAQAHPAP